MSDLRGPALRLRVVRRRASLRARWTPTRARWEAPGAAGPQAWTDAQRRPRRLHPRLSPSTPGRGPCQYGGHGGGAPGAGGGRIGRTTPDGSPGHRVGRRDGPAPRASGAVLAAAGRPLRLGRGSDVPHLGTRASLASPRLRLNHGIRRPRQLVRGTRGCGPLGADVDRRRSSHCQVGL